MKFGDAAFFIFYVLHLRQRAIRNGGSQPERIEVDVDDIRLMVHVDEREAGSASHFEKLALPEPMQSELTHVSHNPNRAFELIFARNPDRLG
jgi:hypothetical protein